MRNLPFVVVVAFAAAVAAAARAGEREIGRANELRDGATADWNAGRYEDAAQKLAEAAALYEAEGDSCLNLRAICLRARCYDLEKADRPDDVVATFLDLSGALEGHTDLESEVRSAYVPVYRVAAARELDDAIALLERVRTSLVEHGHARPAAQVLHDMGYLAWDKGDMEQAVERYAKAIAERERIGDDVGLAWSLNNLASCHLDRDEIDDARPLLTRAFRIVRTNGERDPQASLAVNLNTALEKIGKLSPVPDDDAAWLLEMGRIGAAAPGPECVPADHFLRRALAARPDVATAKAVADVKLPARPPEVRADLVIRAARVATEAGEPRLARKWLEKLDVGEGPVAPHLKARRELETARAEATARNTKRFVETALEAAKLWDATGDWRGTKDAYADLAALAATRGGPEELADLVAKADELRRAGGPGGAGNQASAAGDVAAYRKLAADGIVFSIAIEEDQIVVRDVVANRKMTFPIEWKPRNAGFNGLSLTVFGGYFVPRSLSYANMAVATGAPGEISLDDLGPYRPIPAHGRLVVLKNGATRYD